MEEYTTYVRLLQTPTPTLPPPAHIFLCRPLPHPLCLSRLTHPYDNLCTIKSPNGPQVCQHASVTNKRNAFKRTEALRSRRGSRERSLEREVGWKANLGDVYVLRVPLGLSWSQEKLPIVSLHKLPEAPAVKTCRFWRCPRLASLGPAPQGENENRAQNLRAATRGLKHLLAEEKEERDGRARETDTRRRMSKEQRVGKTEASEEYK
ncbi:hypothetical protein QQF64_028777 [Cirrhinus molitorella]|uniref:Uncharacterized protein n=1 Tax=Cirrhinus molitorella TaxID=172907 RepID=A0ABR3N7L6_9TELE